MSTTSSRAAVSTTLLSQQQEEIQYVVAVPRFAKNMTSAFHSEKHDILVPWWQQHCKNFGLYYLMKSEEDRKDMLLRCLPDMPQTAAGTRERLGEIVTAADMLLPELFVEGLQAGNGRCLILLLARRLASPDTGFENDITLLMSLFKKKTLPLFSNGSLEGLDTPYVELGDADENIKCLSYNCSPEVREAVLEMIDRKRFVHADVWLACSVRRNALADFMLSLKSEYEDELINAKGEASKEDDCSEDSNMGLS